MIDFTIPKASVAFAALTARRQGAHHRHHRAFGRERGKRSRRPRKSAVIVKSGNMSLGVNLLAALTKRVAKTLDDSFDIEIFEMHHNKKIDAPSGTALMFGRAAAEGRGIDLAHAFGARPRRRDRRAQGGRHRLCDACAAARWSASTA